MGDIGEAVGGLFGGGGAVSGLTDADFAGLTDADIMGGAGDAASGAGGLFGGASGGLSQFAQAMSALTGGGSSAGGAGGGGGGGSAADPASIPSPSSAGGGVTSTGGQQSGSQPGPAPAQGQQGGQPDAPPPKSALDELRKLLQGGPKPPGGATTDPFKTGGSAGTQQPPWVKPMANPPFRPTEGGPIPGWTDPTAGDAVTDLPAMPGKPANAIVPSGGQPPAPTGGGTPPAATPPAIEGLPAPGDIRSLAPPAGAGAAIGALNPIARGAIAAGGALQPTPAETGELPAGVGSNVGLEYSPASGGGMPAPQNEAGEQAVGSQPAKTPIGGGAGNVQEAPTGTPKPDPKTGLPSDPASGKPMTPERYKKWFDQQTKGTADASGKLPTKVPTKKPGAEAAPATAAAAPPAAQPGSLMNDLLGGGANPSTLLQLASIALPLIMGAIGGGGRGGGGWRHRGGGFGRFGGFRGGMNAMRGHGPLPGFRGGFLGPGHYPNRGGGFHWHPGGWHEGWNAHPNWGGQGGGGSDPSSIISALFGGGQGGSSGGGGATGNYAGPGSGSANAGANVTARNGPWSDNSFLSTLVGAESGGRQGPGVRGDGGQAKGFFQFHDGTWQRYARNVPGASQYPSAEDAPPEVQQQVAMSAPIREWGPRTKQILHAKFGAFDENQTIGALAGQFGGGGGTRTAAAAPAAPAGRPTWAGSDTASPIT